MKKMIKEVKLSESQKINTSYLMYVFYHYFLYVWLVDSINLTCLFFELPQTIYFSHILSGAILLLACSWDFKRFHFVKLQMTFCDIAFIVIILLLGFYKCIYPDTSHDVMTYHILNQEPIWSTFDHSFFYYQISFPFADRLFYLFRMLGGYRLGTLANALLLIVIFHQLKRVLIRLLTETGIKASRKRLHTLISVSCFAVLLLEAVLMELGTYMTDLVSIPLALELIYQIIEIKEEKISFSKMAYFSSCLAFIFLCKLTGAIIVTVLLAIYLVLVRRSMNRFKFIGSLFIALLVILPFILFNMYLYGVPLYSASSLFGSYAAGNGSGDLRFGGENLFQKIFWPVYMTQYPSSGRHMELIDMPNYYPLTGIIVIAFELCRRGKSVFNKEIKIISIAVILNFYIWSFAGGPDRYKLINLFLFGLIISYTMITYLFSKQRVKALLLGAVLLIQSLGSLYFVLINNNSWQWAPSIIEQIAKEKDDYVAQLHWLGKDRGPLIDNGNSYNVFVATEKPYSLWGKLVNKNAELYQLFALEAKKEWSAILAGLSTKEIYTACPANNLTSCIKSLDEYGLLVCEVQTFYDTYIGNFSILNLDYSPKGKNRIYLLGNSPGKKIAQIKGGKIYQVNALAQILPTVSWTEDTSELTMYFLYKGQKFFVASQTLTPKKNAVFTAEIDLSEMNELEKGFLYLETSNNYGLNWNATQIINPKISIIEDSDTRGTSDEK